MRVLLLAACAVIACSAPRAADAALTVYNPNAKPIRLAQGPDGKIYVTDSAAASVFVYDEALALIGQIKGISQPLGVSVSPGGLIYVGSQGSRNIQVYRPDGVVVGSFANGVVRKPNDMVHDWEGNLYVVDSLLDKVLVFDAVGHHVADIGSSGTGAGQFDFPSTIALAYTTNAVGSAVGELFVGDQRNARVQVFNLQGAWDRMFGSAVEPKGWNGWDVEGKFSRLQSLQVDNRYRVHVLDDHLNQVQILDADTGTFIAAYGTFGVAPGQLNLPLDILVADSRAGVHRVLVANAGNGRVEELHALNGDGDVGMSGGAVLENEPAGTVAAGFNNAAYPGATTYRLVGGAGSDGNGFFTTSATNLLTAAVFNHDLTNQIAIRVKGLNELSVNLALATRLTIEVSDVNEQPQSVGLDDNEVLEAQLIGTTVGTLVTVDDDAVDTYTYTFADGSGDTDNARFTIDGSALKTGVVLDYEAQALYSVRVRSVDSGGLTVENPLAIVVVNVIESSGDVDRDEDGMADWWEYSHSGDPTIMPTVDDMDGDGATNFEEWLAGTDPGNPLDAPAALPQGSIIFFK